MLMWNIIVCVLQAPKQAILWCLQVLRAAFDLELVQIIS